MNRGNMLAKLSCQVYNKFLPVQFIKKDKEHKIIGLQMWWQVQNDKK